MDSNVVLWVMIGCICGLIIVSGILLYAYEMLEQRLEHFERWWRTHPGVGKDTDAEDDNYNSFEGDI